MTTIIYNKNDFELVELNNFANCKYLSNVTLSIINNLTLQVSAPTYSKTPSFPLQSCPDNNNNIKSTSSTNNTVSTTNMSTETRGSSSHFHKGRSGQQYSKMTTSNYKKGSHATGNMKNEDKWRGKKSSFQPTKIQRNKEGSKGTIEDIRLLLNKLTDKTYNKITEQIVDIVNNLESEDVKHEITEQIINIAYVNNTNSKSYAQLLNEIDNQLGVSAGNCIPDIITSYTNSFLEIIGVLTSPDDDYDKFCDMNVSNNKRKGTIQFFCNLSENNLVSVAQMKCLFEEMTHLLKEQLNNSNTLTCNEELIENLFVMSKYVMNNTKDQKNGVLQLILTHDYTGYTKKKYEGITQKAKFKIMDIMDMVKKHKK